MTILKSHKELLRLRTLAHQLKDNLESERYTPSSPDRDPLPARLTQLLDARQVWAQTRGLEDGEASQLRARAERTGVGRRYVEDVVLTVQERRMSLSVTLWVRENQATEGYCGGRWNYHEDLKTGSLRWNYSR